MSTSSRQHQHEVGRRSAMHCARRPLAARSHLSELGVDVVATRLRTLGHPSRLRLLRALDGHEATADQLAEEIGEPVGAVRSHLAILHRAGITCRVDDGGRPTFALADWPSLWLVEQLARRLRERVHEDAADDPSEARSC